MYLKRKIDEYLLEWKKNEESNGLQGATSGIKKQVV